MLLAPLLVCLVLPPLRTSRGDENWTGYKNDGRMLEALKNVRLLPGWRLTAGADVRERFEMFRNEEWGLDAPGTDGFLLQRYMMHAELRHERGFRIFTQFKSNLVSFRNSDPRPVDKDTFDVHQAFFEFARHGTSLRVGRQEVSLGSSRLVSIREGPNVRLAFDGARLDLNWKSWKVALLALRPATTRPGSFDDAPDHRNSLWGVYATHKSGWDAYYLGIDRKRGRFDSGTGREQRQSLGARYHYNNERWDLDYEGVFQFGTFRDLNIRAWTTGTNTGRTIAHLPGKPRLGLKANVTSGDTNRNDRTLGTFNALYPRGNYFSQADVLGPYNLMDLHPGITVRLPSETALNVDWDMFWRYSTSDAIYDVPGNPVVSGSGSTARFIGQAFKVGVEHRFNRYISIEGEYQRLYAGSFLKQNGRAATIDFIGVWTTFRF